MPRRRPLALAAALALAAPAAAAAQEPVTASAYEPSALRCVAPADAAAIDRVLAEAGSPLAGEGASFVQASLRVGLDPRALVAIAAHETMLETYGPAQAIRNPFGLGPGWRFASHRAAIATAARVLGRYYLAEGRTQVAQIGAKWAPVGAANDPTNLNSHWTRGVSTFYAALGGDPARPLLAAAQDATPACALTALPDAAAGPPVVTAWGGAVPAAASARPRDGGDPRTGAPATLPGFVFPLAVPQGTSVRHEAAGGGADATLVGPAGAAVVAPVAGTLVIATRAEQREGVAFWIAGAGGDRLGYGALAGYAPGIAEGAAVAPGRLLGRSPGRLLVAWERDGVRIDPLPLLGATRPSA